MRAINCYAQLRLPRETRPYIMQGQRLRQTTCSLHWQAITPAVKRPVPELHLAVQCEYVPRHHVVENGSKYSFIRSGEISVVKLFLSEWSVPQVVMPISLEQWRSSVGSNNAARSHVIEKHLGKKSPKNLLGYFLQFLMALFSQGFTKGKTKAALLHTCM